ncbi:MAG TPA: M15 family metallopeptidase [Candidatus Paceibacterota bacterium]|nr:M15 family metallopeptidase [Candidatus Paceibacterota bacterium]
MTAHNRLARTFVSLALLAAIAIGGALGFHGIVEAATAPNEAGLSQMPAGATQLTDFEKQALACRNSSQAKQLLAVGYLTPSDRTELGIGSSAADDWCLFLKAHLDNSKQSEVEGLNPGFAQCLTNFIKADDATGGNTLVYSGYRDATYQAQLFNAAYKKYGSVSEARKWVAPPPCSAGTNAVACGVGSMHNQGLAADLEFDGTQGISPAACAKDAACAWAHANAGSFGLHFRLSNEYWHIEPTANACRSAGSVPQTIAQQSPAAGATGTQASPTGSIFTNPITTLTGSSGENATAQMILKGILGGSTGASAPAGTSTGLLGSILGLLGGVGGSQPAATQPAGTAQPAQQPPYAVTPPAVQPVIVTTPAGKEFDVLSEDGTVIATSSVSAVDAINKAQAFYEQGLQATVGSTTATSSVTVTVTSGDPYGLGTGTHVVVDNTFTQSATTGADGTISTTTVPSGTGVSSSFLQSIGQELTTYLHNLLHGLVLQ